MSTCMKRSKICSISSPMLRSEISTLVRKSKTNSRAGSTMYLGGGGSASVSTAGPLKGVAHSAQLCIRVFQFVLGLFAKEVLALQVHPVGAQLVQVVGVFAVLVAVV